MQNGLVMTAEGKVCLLCKVFGIVFVIADACPYTPIKLIFKKEKNAALNGLLNKMI